MRCKSCRLAAVGALTVLAFLLPPAEGQVTTEASVTFEDQTTSGTVMVAAAELPDGGFVVIHDERLQQGDALGSVIGNSSYLEPGNHTDIEIVIESYDGTQNLTAMAHMDTNDNERYEFGSSGVNGTADGPYVDTGGAVVDQAEVTWEADPTPSPTTTTGTVGAGRDDDNGTPGPGVALAVAAVAAALAVRRRR